MVSQVRGSERRDGDDGAPCGACAPGDEAALGRVLPHGQARAGRAPRVEHLGVRTRLGTDPFEEVEDEAFDGVRDLHTAPPRLTCGLDMSTRETPTADPATLAALTAADPAAISDELLEAPAEEERRVTSLELFFDLVFVFAITQVSGYVSADPTWLRLLEGLAILAALWFSWTGYAWLGNTANAEEGYVRVMLFGAMGAMFIASLAVPHAFGSDALAFGLAYFAVRFFHVGTYAAVARTQHNEELAGAVARLGSTILPAATLLVIAGALGGTTRTICWIAALAIDYGGIIVRGIEGWSIKAAHFAERHALVIIIALGESIVSLGVGAGRLPLSIGVITAATLGLAVAAALWWAYFDVVALVGERRLRQAAGPQQRSE